MLQSMAQAAEIFSICPFPSAVRFRTCGFSTFDFALVALAPRVLNRGFRRARQGTEKKRSYGRKYCNKERIHVAIFEGMGLHVLISKCDSHVVNFKSEP